MKLFEIIELFNNTIDLIKKSKKSFFLFILIHMIYGLLNSKWITVDFSWIFDVGIYGLYLFFLGGILGFYSDFIKNGPSHKFTETILLYAKKYFFDTLGVFIIANIIAYILFFAFELKDLISAFRDKGFGDWIFSFTRPFSIIYFMKFLIIQIIILSMLSNVIYFQQDSLNALKRSLNLLLKKFPILIFIVFGSFLLWITDSFYEKQAYFYFYLAKIISLVIFSTMFLISFLMIFLFFRESYLAKDTKDKWVQT